MISIRGQLCYSPLPPSAYGAGRFGLGRKYGDDIQLWNLMYLSIPYMDLYLSPQFTCEQVTDLITTDPVAACIAQVRGEHMIRLYPKMRYWLTLPPRMFMEKIRTLSPNDYETLPTVMSLPDWYNIAWMRAIKITETDPAQVALKKFMKSVTP